MEIKRAYIAFEVTEDGLIAGGLRDINLNERQMQALIIELEDLALFLRAKRKRLRVSRSS